MENNKTISDLSLALIQNILLRLPIKSLLLVRCVCKKWLHLISNPDFAKSHFELAASPTRGCLFIKSPSALSFDLDALFHDGYSAVKFSLPCENPSTVDVLESCRGFVLLDQYPLLIMWNPLTGAHKQVSYSHVVSDVKRLKLVDTGRLCGFGYDPSKDDYMVVLAWKDRNKKGQFDFFSVRKNSWERFEVALPNPLPNNVRRCGLFLNGAFHWLACPPRSSEPILVFDLVEKRFSEIPLPQQIVGNGPCVLVELGGCLALYFCIKDACLFKIWVMKDYKVQSSWTSYGFFNMDFLPISLSSDGDIVGYNCGDDTVGFSKYNFTGEYLEHSSYQQVLDARCTVYTKSLMSLPNDSLRPRKRVEFLL